MEITKSHWVTEGDHVRLSLPISKVDKERRQVSGFATLDNVDQQDDVVLATASKAAFDRFRGNIREMHEPIAAGRLVDFREDSYYDPESKKFYNGIYVTVYVSKGAASTWEKVLDGTLSGFSIGGNINDAETNFVKDSGDNGKSVRFIKDYDLVELSLVDSPCNQFANVFSVQKSVETGELMMKGMAVDTELVNVFWCANDGIAKNSTGDTAMCLSCESPMELIDWFEKGENETDKVQMSVTKFLRQKEAGTVTKENNTGEGGVEMTDEVKKNDEVAEDVVTEEVAVETEEETETEKAAETSEVAAEPDFEKILDGLRDSVNKTLEDNKAAVDAAVESVEKKIADATAAFDEKTSGFEKMITEFSEKLDARKAEDAEVEKRLESLEKATAIKKSGDVETQAPEKKLQKGLWSGTFFDGE